MFMSASFQRPFLRRIAASGILVGACSFLVAGGSSSNCEAASAAPVKTFSNDDVAERNGEDRPEIWVSYRGKVYDITNFVAQHPGGSSMIRQAAGGPIESFWSFWTFHLLSPKAIPLLAKYEIGELDEESKQEIPPLEEIRDQMYAEDPDRKKCKAAGIRTLTMFPYTGETEPSKQETLFTPNDAFYIRNHAPVPVLDAKTHTISLECSLKKNPNSSAQYNNTKNISLQDLTDIYPVVTIPSILQCAGNRSADLNRIAPTSFYGGPFEKIQTGTMGNAEWRGVRIRDVLLDVFPCLQNMTKAELDRYHVEFEGADLYSTSTPLAMVLKNADCLLCTEMNGQPLPRDHGYPVRAFLPGIAGARSVKWLRSVKVVDRECDSCFQKTYYLDPHGRAIQQMPMQSFITSKQKVVNEKANDNKNNNKMSRWKVKGIAWGGGSGIGVSKVEVSSDNGETWQNVDVQRGCERQDASKEWSWVQWEVEMDVPAANAAATANASENDHAAPVFTCRMTDRGGLQQPEKLWYHRGYLSNVWHKL